jgi:hypothetical protein
MENNEPIWKTDGLNTVKYFKVWETHWKRTVGRNSQVHWYGFSQTPVTINIPINRSLGMCTSNPPATTLTRVPVSRDDLRTALGCGVEDKASILLVTEATGEAVIADNWFKAVRWLRRSGGGVILVRQETETVKYRNWRISDYPVCVGIKNDFIGVKLGSTWCSNDNYSKRFHFNAVNPAYNARVSREGLAEICVAKSISDTRRFQFVEGGKCGEEAGWKHVTNLLVKRGDASSEFCLAKQVRKEWLAEERIDVIARGAEAACRDDPYLHFDSYSTTTTVAFRNACLVEGKLTTLCDANEPVILRLLASKPASLEVFAVCLNEGSDKQSITWPAGQCSPSNRLYALSNSALANISWCLATDSSATVGKCAGEGVTVFSVGLEAMSDETLLFVE